MTRSVAIAPQWIGDAVMSEPLLARLAARGEALSVAALPWVAPVYRAMPHVQEVIELPFAHGKLDLPERRRIAGEWRGRFETAYVLPNSIKAALIPAFARIARRVGYHGEGRFGLLTERLRNPTGKPPMVAFYGALAGGVVADDAKPRLQIDDTTRADALRKAGLDERAYWVFAPGAEYGPAKCWPAEHYAALAAALYARHSQPIVLLGSAKEAQLCESIAAAAPGACRVLAGKTSLLEAMALIAASRGIVSNDSGLMHVAAAFGVPQVAVFGSTSPLHTPPLNARARVLWLKSELGLDCMPCFDRECRYGHTRCLTEIEPARVARALDDAQAPNDNALAGN
jgi:heptosyltransferase-2